MSDNATAGTTYQMVTLTPGLADAVIGDGSPQTLLTELWEFLNTELMTANLTWIDFQNILDFVDIRFCNMLLGIPESEWYTLKIQETLYDKDPDTGRVVPVHTKEYNVTELWDAVRTKVYIKCCNSRDGHLIKTLTESRSSIKQQYSEFGTQPQNPAAGITPPKSNWRPI